MVKMTISEAHWKLSHITPVAIKYAITKGHITSIQIDPELKTKFCKACSKAKVAQQPFPKELETHASKYRECVHWDLWGPAAVQSISRNWNVAACIDDMTHETMLYFQVKKSQTIEFCKHNKVPIETQTSNHIKVSHSDWGGEFLSDKLTQHQNIRTKHELTIHDLPQQNGVVECGMCICANYVLELCYLHQGYHDSHWKRQWSTQCSFKITLLLILSMVKHHTKCSTKRSLT